ncbi:MAG: hypothetical protein JKY61_07685 [Planctomycetes bacterium]|nr:hypothetical protein [Planctomycetota bacterium]
MANNNEAAARGPSRPGCPGLAGRARLTLGILRAHDQAQLHKMFGALAGYDLQWVLSRARDPLRPVSRAVGLLDKSGRLRRAQSLQVQYHDRRILIVMIETETVLG